ncbi:MAG: hypothetical protein PHD95_05995 [Candidatus ainarchaeum sp.]|nr:hypothetical protein [Candidatus ainarchaeum sp.]
MHYCAKSHQAKAFVPTDARKSLCLNPFDSLEIVDIRKANQFVPSSQMFVGNQIDLRFFIPKETRRGFKFFVEEINKGKEAFLIIKYPTNNGSSNQVSIKRFVNPIDFGAVLGQLQAEGTKFTNLLSNQSPRLIFANKSIEEHRQFTNFLENMGIEKTLIKANCHYNPYNCPEEKIKNQINKFKGSTGITQLVIVIQATKSYTIVFGLWWRERFLQRFFCSLWTKRGKL